MFGFPTSTEFNKRIPKQKFYENLDISPELKRIFVEQIHFIYWRNKLATTTLNLARGETVSEIEVFEVMLNDQQLDEAVLHQIDKEIPYHILFVLTYESKAQAWIGYKESTPSGIHSFKVGQYYHTEWIPVNKLLFHIDGLNIDTVYDNLFRQIAKNRLHFDLGASLEDSIYKDIMRKKLRKQITELKRKLIQEKQLNKQIEIKAELQKALIKLEVL